MPNPPLSDAQIAKLEKLLDVAGEDVASPGQVAEAITHVIEATKSAFAILKNGITNASAAAATEDRRLDGRIDDTNTALATTKKELQTSIRSISLTPGPKGDSIKGDPGKDGEDGQDGSPDAPKDVRDKLETLQGNERLDPSAIRGLDELERKVDEKTGNTVRIGWGAHPLTIQALGVAIDKNTRFINFTGSGITSVSRNKNGVVNVNISGSGSGGTLVSEEVPTDSGDHINFTIAHTPTTGTFRLYRGGTRQASIGATPDYTLTGTDLVLGTALNIDQGEQLFCDYEYV